MEIHILYAKRKILSNSPIKQLYSYTIFKGGFIVYDSKLNSTSFEVATSILQVQIPAYKVEADYLNSTAIPRLYDTVNDIQNCVETFYGYFSENKLVGFISFVQEEKLIDIHRLVVSPDFFKRNRNETPNLYI